MASTVKDFEEHVFLKQFTLDSKDTEIFRYLVKLFVLIEKCGGATFGEGDAINVARLKSEHSYFIFNCGALSNTITLLMVDLPADSDIEDTVDLVKAWSIVDEAKNMEIIKKYL